MRMIDQRTSSDCLRCCVATVLDISYEEVPDFVTDFGREWVEPFIVWAELHKINVLRFRACGLEGELLPHGICPTSLWIAGGPTERGTNHAVVYAGTEMIHDPHTSKAGLLAITSAMVLIGQ